MGSQSRSLIIAEVGVNHNGDLRTAVDLVQAAADAGADVVKFQTFKASRLVTRTVSRAAYQQEATASSSSQFSMLESLELDQVAFATLAQACRDAGVKFMSTPFDEQAATYLVSDLGLEIVKIGSGDLTNGPLLLHVAQLGRPVILSTGMSTLSEVEAALAILGFGYVHRNRTPSSLDDCLADYPSETCQRALAENVSLLHCTTEYPAAPESVNLRCMATLSAAFCLPVGFSDHTPGIHIAVAAAALGAKIIEKHLTLDRQMQGPDHRASLEPGEFAQMCKSIREIEVALGSGIKLPHSSELANKKVARRAVVAARPIRDGTVLSKADLAVKRAAAGHSALSYWGLIGQKASKDYEADDPVLP